MKRGLSRRLFLRGAGCTIALPWLPSLMRSEARAANVGVRPRFVVMYAPNGMHMPAWTPSSFASGWALSESLSPLSAYRDRMTVASGLDLTGAFMDRDGFHARSTAAFLTNHAITPTRNPGEVTNGWSIDQILARDRDGDQTLPSLQVGPRNQLDNVDPFSDWPFAYNAAVSWRANTPIFGSYTPLSVWRRIIGGTSLPLSEPARLVRLAERRSVLDGVLDDLNGLRARAGGEDASRLDAYVEGIRALELRLDNVPPSEACGLTEPEHGFFDYWGEPEVMLQLIATALACDTTRIATFMIAAGGSGKTFSEFGHEADHHAISHHGGDEERWRDLEEINRWETSLVADFAGMLERELIGEDGQTLLDDTVILYGSGMSDGDTHSPRNLPLALIGDAGGRLRTGAHLDLTGRSMADLHLTLLQALGLPMTEFTDSSGPMEELLVRT